MTGFVPTLRRGGPRALAWLACLACPAALLLPTAALQAQTPYDPLERVNRGIFAFNNVADRYVLEPVAKGYRAVAPAPVRRSVVNFLSNLRSPVVFANDLLQGERERAGVTLGRFMINTTLGVAGLFDAAAVFGYQAHDEDLGQTLGVYGLPQGPYLMLPLLGPSTARDAAGRVGDYFIDPLNSCCVTGDERLARFGAGTVSSREQLIETIDDLRRNTFDAYATVRSAYLQQRAAALRNGRDPAPGGEDVFTDPGAGDSLQDPETGGLKLQPGAGAAQPEAGRAKRKP